MEVSRVMEVMQVSWVMKVMQVIWVILGNGSEPGNAGNGGK